MDQTMNSFSPRTCGHGRIVPPERHISEKTAMNIKTIKWIAPLLLLSPLAPAQMDKLSQPATQPTTSQVLDAWIGNTESHLVPVAEAMPEDKYSFAPSNGEFKNVRTFGEQLKHLAANNYRQAAVILGEKPTTEQVNEQGPDSVKTKAELVDYLKGSFSALHMSVATIDARNQVEPMNGTSGTWQRARLGLAIDAVAHSFNHYGQLVECLCA
jgi:hypothetical protein